MIHKSAMTLAASADGSPVSTTIVVLLFYLMFTILEAGTEKLIFGERFAHWLDPLFASAFIAYAAYAVYACALYNSAKGV